MPKIKPEFRMETLGNRLISFSFEDNPPFSPFITVKNLTSDEEFEIEPRLQERISSPTGEYSEWTVGVPPQTQDESQDFDDFLDNLAETINELEVYIRFQSYSGYSYEYVYEMNISETDSEKWVVDNYNLENKQMPWEQIDSSVTKN